MTARVFLIVLLAAQLPLVAATRSDVFQYAAPGTTVDGKPLTSFLWVPPEADRIRGVLVGGVTLMEPAFATDPRIRAVCAEEKLAIVLMSPSVDAVFNYKEKGAGEALQKILDALTAASCYREIAVAPLFPFGHSVSSIFAGNVAYWKPARCFGVLAFKGGLGSMASDPQASLAGVPILCVKGQFEEFGPGPSGVLRENEDRETSWKGMRAGLIERRKKDPNVLASLIVEAGASHFAWSQRVSEHVAVFLRKCAKARIPEWPMDATAQVTCIVIKPESGIIDKDGLWHFDQELARGNEDFKRALQGKEPQFVTFAGVKSGKPIFVGHDLRLKLKPEWSGADTFKVARTYLEKSPDKYPKTEDAGHAATPIQFRVFGGAAEQIAPNEFRVGMNAVGKIRAEILAFNPGDDKYRWAEQQGRIMLPEKLNAGKAQVISFASIGSRRCMNHSKTMRRASMNSAEYSRLIAGLPSRLSERQNQGSTIEFATAIGARTIIRSPSPATAKPSRSRISHSSALARTRLKSRAMFWSSR
jgi:hypothetical protein